MTNGLLSFRYFAFAASDAGRVPANMSSILLMKAMVTNDLIIIFKFGSFINVNISAKTVTIELVVCIKESSMLINLPFTRTVMEFYLFR